MDRNKIVHLKAECIRLRDATHPLYWPPERLEDPDWVFTLMDNLGTALEQLLEKTDDGEDTGTSS